MIAVNGVSKNYGSVTAVDDLTFTVDRGEVVGFLGPNGAGKTTLLEAIQWTFYGKLLQSPRRKEAGSYFQI